MKKKKKIKQFTFNLCKIIDRIIRYVLLENGTKLVLLLFISR